MIILAWGCDDFWSPHLLHLHTTKIIKKNCRRAPAGTESILYKIAAARPLATIPEDTIDGYNVISLWLITKGIVIKLCVCVDTYLLRCIVQPLHRWHLLRHKIVLHSRTFHWWPQGLLFNTKESGNAIHINAVKVKQVHLRRPTPDRWCAPSCWARAPCRHRNQTCHCHGDCSHVFGSTASCAARVVWMALFHKTKLCFFS